MVDIDGQPMITARFFDGQSAAAQTASVTIMPDGLEIATPSARHFWPAAELRVLARTKSELRLGRRGNVDASLIMPASALEPLMALDADLFSGARARRRMTGLIAAMVLGAGAVGAGLFFGVPAASGPLARATPRDVETQIGENFAAQITTLMRPCPNSAAAAQSLSPLIEEMRAAGDIEFEITFKVVNSSIPNAFALPGGHVMATAGLVDALEDDPEAFAGVLAHELGHVRARDGMQAFYRNIGLGLALEVITGGSGVAQQAVLLGGQLNQLRHTRRQEQRADDAAFEIMTDIGLDPAALGRAFVAITHAVDEDHTADDAHAEDSPSAERDNPNDDAADNQPDKAEKQTTAKNKSAVKKSKKRDRGMPAWLNSHPETTKRIKAAKQNTQPATREALSAEAWAMVVSACDTPPDTDK